jgi:hypothetical protein
MITRSALERFFSGIQAPQRLAKKLREQANIFLAEDFNCFDYLDTSEPGLSQISANLLRPDGSHGQGDVFLASFLALIGLTSRSPGPPPLVLAEEPTRFINRPRFIDIKIRWDDFSLGIENKLWAEDQDEQLADYVRDLERESQGRFLLVYLSGDGSDPDPNSISKELLSSLKEAGRIKVLSFPDVMFGWLDDCINRCQADRVRWFLRDFCRYLARTFPEWEGSRSVSAEDELIVDYALQNDEQLELSIAVGTRLHRIQERVITRFIATLKKRLMQELPGAVVVDESMLTEPLTKGAGLSLASPEWTGLYSISLESETRNASKMFFGIGKKHPEPGRQLGDLGDKLNLALGRGGTERSWEWWQYFAMPYLDWSSDKALLGMFRGEALDFVGQRMVQLFRITEAHLRERDQS